MRPGRHSRSSQTQHITGAFLLRSLLDDRRQITADDEEFYARTTHQTETDTNSEAMQQCRDVCHRRVGNNAKYWRIVCNMANAKAKGPAFSTRTTHSEAEITSDDTRCARSLVGSFILPPTVSHSPSALCYQHRSRPEMSLVTPGV